MNKIIINNTIYTRKESILNIMLLAKEHGQDRVDLYQTYSNNELKQRLTFLLKYPLYI